MPGTENTTTTEDPKRRLVAALVKLRAEAVEAGSHLAADFDALLKHELLGLDLNTTHGRTGGTW